MSTQITLTPDELAEIQAQRAAQAAPAGNASALMAPDSAPPAAPAAQPSGVLSLVQALLSPVLAGVAGSKAAALAQLGEVGLGLGTVVWKMFNKHTGHTSYHPTLGDAQQAALVQFHTVHPGTLGDPANNTAMEITPVIKVGVPDALAQPKPVKDPPTIP
jgi:hypothetical protein